MVHYAVCAKKLAENMKKQIDELTKLPVQYFDNYSLLATTGILFEILVWCIRSQTLELSVFMQTVAVGTVQVTILQTAAEYFRPDGNAGFGLRLAAALAHYAFFSALICMQIEMSVPMTAYALLLGAGFWLAAIFETGFRGKKKFLFMTGLMLGWGIMRRIMADAYESTGFSCRGLILTNLLLFLLLAFLWHVCRNVPQKRKAVR